MAPAGRSAERSDRFGEGRAYHCCPVRVRPVVCCTGTRGGSAQSACSWRSVVSDSRRRIPLSRPGLCQLVPRYRL